MEEGSRESATDRSENIQITQSVSSGENYGSKNVSFKMDHDWQSGKTVTECNTEMLNHEILCDVTFLVGKGHPFTVVKAHKYMLVSRSATFYEYFCGKVPDPMIIVRDIEPEVFKHLLWYIYTDEIPTEFDILTPLVYAAKRYQLDGLAKYCLELLEKARSPTNVCSLLKQAGQLNETQLEEDCLEYIYGNANQVFLSASFLDLDSDYLGKIINSDALRADEERVYEAVYSWSESECHRQKLKPTHSNRQRVIGNLKYLIRFPVMDVDYFTSHVANQDLLTQDEKEAIYKYLHSRTAPEMEWFITRKRALTRAIRFESTAGSWQVGKFADTIQFQCSHDFFLDGILVYGCYYVGCDYEVTVKVLDVRDQLLSETKTNISTTINQDIYDIIFEKALPIRAQTWYTVGVFMSGPPTRRGVQGRDRIYIEKVHFLFKACNMNKTLSSLKEGQIPGIIFH